MKVTAGRSDDALPRFVRRGVPDLVAAQLTGVLGGLAVALDHFAAPKAAPEPRFTIVDRELTRC